MTMHGNFHCVKFHDFTQTQIFGLVFTFALTYYQKAYFFIPGGHFNWKKQLLSSWQLQQCCLQSSMLAQENHYQSFGHLCLNSQ